MRLSGSFNITEGNKQTSTHAHAHTHARTHTHTHTHTHTRTSAHTGEKSYEEGEWRERIGNVRGTFERLGLDDFIPLLRREGEPGI